MGQDLRGPGRPDMMRRWYLWYGMSSRNLYKKTETSQATYLASNKTFEFIIGGILEKKNIFKMFFMSLKINNVFDTEGPLTPSFEELLQQERLPAMHKAGSTWLQLFLPISVIDDISDR